MAKIIKIENEEVINMLQAYGYEVEARQDLLSHMVQQGVSTAAESFVAYHKEYEEMYSKYAAAKAEFEAAYVKPLLPDGVSVSWNLDYATAECTITGID